jgi:hypothetical protein
VELISASSAGVSFCFLVGAWLRGSVDPEELLMFTIEPSSSDEGTEHPVGAVFILRKL